VEYRQPHALKQRLPGARQYESQVLLESYHPARNLRVLVIIIGGGRCASVATAEVCGEWRETHSGTDEKQSRTAPGQHQAKAVSPMDR